jgi:hypothetical protein
VRSLGFATTTTTKRNGAPGNGGNDSWKGAEVSPAIVAMVSITALACLATWLALWSDAKKRRKANEELERQRRQWEHL